MRRTALRLPEAEGPRIGHIAVESAEGELNLLFVGDSTMAGVGVPHQSFAMAMQAAAILANQLVRPVRWQIVAKSGVNTSQCIKFALGQKLLPADVLITALGTNDVTSQATPLGFVESYQELIQGLSARVGAKFAVISGLPPLHLTPAAPQPLRWYLGKYAHLLDKHLQRWIVPQRHVGYVSLQWASEPEEMAADGYHPGALQYTVWANLIAAEITNLLKRSEPDPT